MSSTTNYLALEQSGILRQIVHDTCTIMDCDAASIIIWNAQRSAFDVGAVTNNLQNIAQRIRNEGGATRWIVDNQQPIHVNDVNNGHPFPGNNILDHTELCGFIGTPIIYDNEVLGVLYVLSSKPNSFSDVHVSRLEALANVAAVAVYKSRLAQHLKELNAFKDAMMGLAAHDLRNPLSRVVGYLNILIEDVGPFSDEHSAWIDQIFKALDQMRDLIDGVLHYEQLTQEGENMTLAPQDLNHLVRSVAEQFEPDLDHKDQHFEFDLMDETMLVNMDVLLLGEAIGNLLGNAIKYSPEGSRIMIRTLQENGVCQVHIIDEGAGIDSKYHEKIFQPFARLQEAKSQPGNGLGLNLVKQIVELHGGHVSLESEVGEGSTFIVNLPCRQS